MESQKQEDIAPVADDYFFKCILYLKMKTIVYPQLYQDVPGVFAFGKNTCSQKSAAGLRANRANLQRMILARKSWY